MDISTPNRASTPEPKHVRDMQIIYMGRNFHSLERYYSVRVGCETFALSEADLTKFLIDYIASPQEVEADYYNRMEAR